MKSNAMITRSQFLSFAVAVAGFFAIGLFFTKKIFAASSVKEKRTLRTYEHDQDMKLRKSQDNPMINEIYKDFLEHPNSHKAHTLLHTHYVDRSSRINKMKNMGIKVQL